MCCLCGVTYLTKMEFLFRKHHPEDGRITGKNLFVRIL